MSKLDNDSYPGPEVFCSRCNKPVVTKRTGSWGGDLEIDAWIECPKCIEKGKPISSPIPEEASGVSSTTLKKLIRFGLLDEDLNITPNAIMPAVLRKTLQVQCMMLGVRLIYRRPTKKDAKVEEQISRYLVNHYGGFADRWEGSPIKNMFGAFIEGFDAGKRKTQLPDEELKERCSQISTIDDIDIVYWWERFNYQDGPPSFNIDFQGELSDVSKPSLRARYRASKSKPPLWVESDEDKEERLRYWKNGTKFYVTEVMEQLALWHSLTPETWSRLAWTALSDWKNMRSGWPDITHVDRHGQLRLLEIKTSDKLHASQIYVLQKLLNLLGEDRIAIIAVGTGYGTDVYRDHLKETDKWFRKKLSL